MGSFKWTAGVVGVAVVILKAKIASFDFSKDDEWIETAGISSHNSKIASSLDYALSKKPNWLLDMFGVDSKGSSLSKRVFLRSNPERKRAGPVRIALNPSFVNPNNICIELDGVKVENARELGTLLNEIGYVDRYFDKKQLKQKRMRAKNHILAMGSEVDEELITTWAIEDLEPAILSLTNCSPTEFALAFREIEDNLVGLMRNRVGQCLNSRVGARADSIVGSDITFVSGSMGLISIRAGGSVDDPCTLMLALGHPNENQEILSVEAIDEKSRYGSVKVVGEKELRPLGIFVAKVAALYWKQAQGYLRDQLSVIVRSINGQGVDKLYSLVRRHLIGGGASEAITHEFSIYAHIGGKSRYMLDDVRFRCIQNQITRSASPNWQNNAAPVTRLVQTEAWYATSVSNSCDTMSYTDAVLPNKAWCGTPDVWKHPIPGFGASEIAVYGAGRSWAEPIGFDFEQSGISLCAVYTNEASNRLGGRFLKLPKISNTIGEKLTQELLALPLAGQNDKQKATAKQLRAL